MNPLAMRRFPLRTLLYAVLAAQLLAACATPRGPNVEKMEAKSSIERDTGRRSGAFTKATLIVGNIASELGASGSDAQSIRESLWLALIASLQKSGLFAAVVTNGAAQYRLDGYIVSHRSYAAIAVASTDLVVRYSLTDTRTGAILCKQTIVSHYDSNESIAGADEGASRHNLTKLLNKLSECSLDAGKLPSE